MDRWDGAPGCHAGMALCTPGSRRSISPPSRRRIIIRRQWPCTFSAKETNEGCSGGSAGVDGCVLTVTVCHSRCLRVRPGPSHGS